MSESSLVIVKTYSSFVVGDLDKALLESNKIRCLLQADRSRPSFPSALFVRKEDLETARKILEKIS